MPITYLDTETHLIEPGRKAPPIVCVQILDQSVDLEPRILKRDIAKAIVKTYLKEAISDEECFLCFHRAAYDLAVICATWPEFTTLVFEVLEQGKVWDTGIRDKLLNLGRFGWVDKQPIPGEYDDEGEPKTKRIGYGLDDLALRRLAFEMDKSNPWRLRFSELEDVPLAEWPKEATEYALDDVRVLPLIFEDQDRDVPQVPSTNAFAAHTLAVCRAFALYMMSCQGVAIDAVERARVEAMLAEELAPEKIQILFDCGILRPAELPRPKRGGGLTKGKRATKNMAVLKGIVVEVCERLEIPVELTETKLVSTRSGFLAGFDHLDPRLEEYSRVQALQKLVTTEMPRIQADRVYPNFDELKETGRTSSWDPNIQNVDPRAKGCYVPEPGWVICSVDYSTIELVTFAQKLLDLFGKSYLADLLRQGVDPHAYLGAQLALEFDREGFERHTGVLPAPGMDAYHAFIPLKKLPKTDPRREWFDHWRNFAKPVGLGYPGGLGPKTMVTLAKGTYYVEMTVEQAGQSREVWRATFPEVLDYFRWVNEDCAVQVNGEDRYQYMSPMGMLRNGCTYCACANGAALQTPAAEGGTFAMWSIVRACKDPAQKSILYGCRPWAWVHDEMLLNIPEDRWMHERAFEVARLMKEGMEHVIRDVPVKAQPALMKRWDKRAEGVFGADGRIRIWEPATKA